MEALSPAAALAAALVAVAAEVLAVAEVPAAPLVAVAVAEVLAAPLVAVAVAAPAAVTDKVFSTVSQTLYFYGGHYDFAIMFYCLSDFHRRLTKIPYL